MNTRDFNLTRGSSDLLAAVRRAKHPGEIKPEITESMIEISTGIARNVAQLYSNLTQGRFSNSTAARSVDSNLAAILVREGYLGPSEALEGKHGFLRAYAPAPRPAGIAASSKPCTRSSAV